MKSTPMIVAVLRSDNPLPEYMSRLPVDLGLVRQL